MPAPVDWGVVIACMQMRDDGRERMRAEWLTCCEVVEHARAYAPVECDAVPPSLAKLNATIIRAHADHAETDRDKEVIRAFRWWRAHVTEVEALNAGRLAVLASTLRTLADLLPKSTQPELVHERIAALGAFVEGAWHVAIPLTGELRLWSLRVVRRYDLLPRDWRDL